jgi:hypothetical protein
MTADCTLISRFPKRGIDDLKRHYEIETAIVLSADNLSCGTSNKSNSGDQEQMSMQSWIKHFFHSSSPVPAKPNMGAV